MTVSVYSTIATIENAPSPTTLMASAINRGKVRVQVGSYTAASLAASSEIALFRLHLGDVVLLAGSWLGSEDNLGSGVTFALGDNDSVTAVDADRYLEATAIATAAIIQLNDAVACLSKVPYTIQEDCWCILTVGDEVTGDIRFEILLSNNN